jgi:hypothetical protein
MSVPAVHSKYREFRAVIHQIALLAPPQAIGRSTGDRRFTGGRRFTGDHGDEEAIGTANVAARRRRLLPGQVTVSR